MKVNRKKEEPQKRDWSGRLGIVIGIVGIALTLYFYYNRSHVAEIKVVNSSVLIEKYKGTAEVKKKIETETKELTARVDTLMMEFQNELKKYEKERASMSPKEKELQEQLLQKKQGEFQGYRDATDKKVKEQQMKITKEMLNKINDFIKDYAKAKNYKLIVAGNASGNVLYASDLIDITDEVVEAVNADYLKTK